MSGINRIPVSLIFKNPMEVEEKNSAPWNVFRTVFDLHKCKYKDLTHRDKVKNLISKVLVKD